MKNQNNTGSKSQLEARDGQWVPPVWAEPTGETDAHACNRDTESCCTDGASPSNTAPAKYIQNQNTTPLRCAVDSLYLSFHGELTPDIEALLDVLKTQAQDQNPLIAAEAYLSIADHKFEVKSKGQGRFSYVLDDNWFHIQLSSRKAQKLPLAHVQIKSELLTFNDLDEIINHLNQVINRLGKQTKPSTVSRLDLCMDFTCLPSFDIEHIDIKHWKTRASQIDQFYNHKALTGWRIGKGAIMGRIYNKSLEIKKSRKDYLKPLWEINGWDEVTNVWRIEFQFRREFLANVNLLHPNDITDLSPSLWKYATTQWLQLVQPTSDKNESRWPKHPAWLEISAACTNTECQAVRKVTKKRIPNDQFLFVNGISAISSFMARESISDLGEALGEFLHRAELHHSATKDISMAEYLLKKAFEKSKRYNTNLKD
mgnify:CR=1 FL=1